jgi:hypothetical protein
MTEAYIVCNRHPFWQRLMAMAQQRADYLGRCIASPE